MRGGNPRSYQSFPAIEEQLGYNPARFLDTPAPSEINDLSPLATVQAFIRGMDDIETVRAWLEVEVALAQGDDGPRKQVIKWLNHRQAALQDTESQTNGAAQAVESLADDPSAATTPETVEHPADTSSSGGEASTATALAADGGTTPDETPRCPDCQGELTREEIAGQVGYWCPRCQIFRDPATEVAP